MKGFSFVLVFLIETSISLPTMNYQMILLSGYQKKNLYYCLKKIGLLSYSAKNLIKITFGLKRFEETLYLPKGLNLSNNRSTRLGMFFLKGSDGLLSMGDSSTLSLINLSRSAQVWFSSEAYFT